MDPPIIGHPIIGHPIIGHPIIGHRINRPGNKWIKFDVIKLMPEIGALQAPIFVMIAKTSTDRIPRN
jgi:hypothetical protein